MLRGADREAAAIAWIGGCHPLEVCDLGLAQDRSERRSSFWSDAELVRLLGALRSRSTQSSRCWAENHQELLVGVREAAEIMAAIESTGGARAAMDVPDAPPSCASSAPRVWGCGC